MVRNDMINYDDNVDSSSGPQRRKTTDNQSWRWCVRKDVNLRRKNNQDEIYVSP